MNSVFHCELAWLGGPSPTADVAIGVEGDRMVSVTPGVKAPPDAIRLRGLTLPGLANAHSHAFHRALRGRTHGGRGTFWTWREQMYRLAAVLDPPRYGRLARAVFAEMALAGITCVGEFHYLHHQPGGRPYADPNAMAHALLAAASEAGVRITLLDTCYLRGGFGQAVSDAQLRFSDGDVGAWLARFDALSAVAGPSVRVGAAVHSVRAVDAASIATIAEFAYRSTLPLHAHLSEQPAENDACLAAHGCSPTELLARHGVLDAAFTAVHATHLTDVDIDLLGRHRSTICVCPTTERDLADGVGPSARLHAAGAQLALGSDSHAVIDLFEEARALELDERLVSLTRGSHSVPELLAAATANGHASLGWSDAGRIEPGALADLVTIRLDSVRTAGTDAEHSLATAVFAAGAADVEHVVVGGRVVVDDSKHVSIDVAAELRQSISELWGAA